MPADKAANMPMDAKITELHEAYCAATGFDLPLRMGRDRTWFDFEKAGFTKDDLLLVVRWIRKQSQKQSGYGPNSLRFSTLLQLDYFEEKLLLARQELGRRPRTAPVVEQRQRAGDVERIIEVGATSADPAPAGGLARNALRDWRLAQEGRSKIDPLPTS